MMLAMLFRQVRKLEYCFIRGGLNLAVSLRSVFVAHQSSTHKPNRFVFVKHCIPFILSLVFWISGSPHSACWFGIY